MTGCPSLWSLEDAASSSHYVSLNSWMSTSRAWSGPCPSSGGHHEDNLIYSLSAIGTNGVLFLYLNASVRTFFFVYSTYLLNATLAACPEVIQRVLSTRSVVPLCKIQGITGWDAVLGVQKFFNHSKSFSPLWNQKCHYLFHNSPPLHTVLRLLNQVKSFDPLF